MFRPALRTAATYARPNPQIRHLGRRFASTRPSKSGSFKATVARWTAAGAIVYFYNTSVVFAEEPQYLAHAPPETPRETPETYSTIDTIAEQRRAQARSNLHSSSPSSSQASSQDEAPQRTVAIADGEQTAPGGPAALEEEADQQGAFNEETGEINWDCPCLGGMAHGPCGEQFRAAFSCFVYSKEEPKGVDCIEHFKTMQDCFRNHPDIYGAELDDDEVAEVQAEEDRAQKARGQDEAREAPGDTASTLLQDREDAQRVKSESSRNEVTSETDQVVPKARHDGDSGTAK